MQDNQINRIRVGKKIKVMVYEEIKPGTSINLSTFDFKNGAIKWIEGIPYKVTIV